MYFMEEMCCSSMGEGHIVIESALDFLHVLCFFMWLYMFLFVFSLVSLFGLVACCLCVSLLSFVCCVPYELDLVSCLLFGGHLKF